MHLTQSTVKKLDRLVALYQNGARKQARTALGMLHKKELAALLIERFQLDNGLVMDANGWDDFTQWVLRELNS